MRFCAILLSILLFSGCSLNRGAQVTDEEARFQKTFETPDQKKEETYLAVRTWFVENFENPKSVIQFEDKESGKIIGKFQSKTYLQNNYYDLRTVLTVKMEEENVRLIFSHPEYRTTSETYEYEFKPLRNAKALKKVKSEWAALAESVRARLLY